MTRASRETLGTLTHVGTTLVWSSMKTLFQKNKRESQGIFEEDIWHPWMFIGMLSVTYMYKHMHKQHTYRNCFLIIKYAICTLVFTHGCERILTCRDGWFENYRQEKQSGTLTLSRSLWLGVILLEIFRFLGIIMTHRMGESHSI